MQAAVISLAGKSNQPDKPKHTPRFSAGIKAGYEMGTSRLHANKIVASAFLQYHFNPRLSLMLQPAAKYATYTAAELSKDAYYRITDTSRKPYTPGGINPLGQDDYMIYKETYDSIIVARSIPRAYKWQFDIPLLLNYKLLPNFEIYGGPHINIAGVTSPQENTTTFSGITRIDTVRLAHISTSALYDTPAISKVFPHTASPLGNYNSGISGAAALGSVVPDAPVNPVRLGITFGASYIFRQRLTLDIQYIQAVTGAANITDEKIRNLYYQPYIRMTLGYRFFK
jgi:hypothetical protein